VLLHISNTPCARCVHDLYRSDNNNGINMCLFTKKIMCPINMHQLYQYSSKGHSLQSHAATSSFSISRPIENLLFAVRLETSAHLPTAQAIHSSSSPPCRKVVWSHQFLGPRVSGSVSFPHTLPASFSHARQV
jgi:hypothetical protein